MRYELRTGTPEVLVIHGWDWALSFFLEIRSLEGTLILEHDATTKGDQTNIPEILDQLVQAGLCTEFDLHEAREMSQLVEDANELEDASEGVMTALTVLLNLRRAASG